MPCPSQTSGFNVPNYVSCQHGVRAERGAAPGRAALLHLTSPSPPNKHALSDASLEARDNPTAILRYFDAGVNPH
ncbi:hypothetical protein ANN_16611 [Periplaneta americana]|uniref:Uncharacterized protein n=1 Tax=Periplaneta americana TaxID=6978 RepID=A0ABQ8SRN5_PERAM|nr:hypothetical protein ANN_16611 [Periplaneta americana]